MKKTVSNIFLLTCLAAGLSSCVNCSEPDTIPDRDLTEEETSFVPYQQGQALAFTDEAGNRDTLRCLSVTRTGQQGSQQQQDDPCGNPIQTWDVLTAELSSILQADSANPLRITISLSGPGDYSVNYPANSFWSCLSQSNSGFLQLRFQFGERNSTLPPDQNHYSLQTFYGRPAGPQTAELLNFTFVPQLTLGGQTFNNVNFQAATTDSAVRCIPAPPTAHGIDSIYYNNEAGLIRFTLINGKKYQRVL